MSGFEQAREALDTAISEGAINDRSADQQLTTKGTDHTSGKDEQTAAAIQAIVELDKLEKVKFKGKEWSPKEIEDSMLRQSDYTKKTQELSQERRFVENLPYDLMSVFQNPEKASQFKQIYPEKFHRFLDEFLGSKAQTTTNPYQASAPQTPQANQYATIDPRTMQEFEALKKGFYELQNGWKQTETEKSQAQLDTLFQTMAKKYPSADERTVIATAQALRSDGHEMTQEVWDRIFKQEHDRLESMFKARRDREVKEQLEANKRGRDVGGSGGIPGQGPKKLSMKEATEAAIAALSGQSN